jgi:shikimate kinase
MGDGPHLVILGQMGVGKSTTGSAVANALGWGFADSDEDIATLFERDGRAIAAEEGIDVLHQVEQAVLLGALARTSPTVVTAAASTVERPLVRRVLPRRATVVRLDAPLEVVLRRQAAGGHRRPMAAEELAVLAERRGPLFREVEDRCLSAERPVGELVDEIVGLVRDGDDPACA